MTKKCAHTQTNTTAAGTTTYVSPPWDDYCDCNRCPVCGKRRKPTRIIPTWDNPWRPPPIVWC